MTMTTSHSMRIAILGTRGIPNQYGGFEQFAEYLAVGLRERGHQVAVYIPDFHPIQDRQFFGVDLIRIPCPERYLGAAANFIYDYLCLRDAITRGFNVGLECGYGTASPSYFLLPFRNLKIATNMDGLEWKRAKWPPIVQRFMRWTEFLAVKKSDALVADNPGIQEYLQNTYGTPSTYIPYGADLVPTPSLAPLEFYNLIPGNYYLAVARLEPENNLEMVIDGYLTSRVLAPLLIVGALSTRHGRELSQRYKDIPDIRFLGSIYDKNTLDALRHYAALYFHGHSVGGTNPSLLEAMACGALIAAHDNSFNRGVIQDAALYFASSEDVSSILQAQPHPQATTFRELHLVRIKETFSWPSIVIQYETLFYRMINANSNRGEV